MTKTRRRKTCGVCVARKDFFFFSTKIPHIKYTNKKKKGIKRNGRTNINSANGQSKTPATYF